VLTVNAEHARLAEAAAINVDDETSRQRQLLELLLLER
jgi:hypothetical protein